MKFYFDTEFSSLTSSSEMISMGVAAENGATYYCELAPLPKRCSAFVKTTVIPLLEGNEAVVEKSEFQRRLADWLSQWGEPIELVSDSTWDIFVLRKAITGKGAHPVGNLLLRTSSGTGISAKLSVTPLLHEGKQAVFDAATHAHRETDPREHHALADAMAFRAGIVAVDHWQQSQSNAT